MEKFIPIVFAIDNKYVKQLSTCIISILENASNSNQFEFNILNTDISEENKKIICTIRNEYNNANFNFIDIKPYIKNNDLEKYMSRRENYNYISIETYFRFYIPQIFAQYDKILYLDADTVAFRNIADLFNNNIEDVYAGVVNDLVIENFVHQNKKMEQIPFMTISEYFKEKLLKTSTKYFNAGVLLLNLKKIRQDNIVEKLWQFTTEHSPLEYQDQDVLNAVLENNVKYLDNKWNVLRDRWAANRHFDTKIRRKLMKDYNNPGIFHFVGADKPWVVDTKSSYDYANINQWWNYYKKTPFFDKNDLIIRRHIRYQHIFYTYRTLICINICNFVLIHLYSFQHYFRIVLFDFYRKSLYYKKPKDFISGRSI